MDGSFAQALVWGGIAFGVLYGVFTIIPDTWRAARLPVSVVAAVMGAMNGLTRPELGVTSVSGVERELMESETVGGLARAFKHADPMGFAAYVEQIHAATTRGEANSAAMIQASVIMQGAVEARLGGRPRADVVAYYIIRRDELLELRDTNPVACRQIFFGAGEPTPVDVSQSLLERRTQLYERAFGPVSAPIAPMSDADLEVALNVIRDHVGVLVGADRDLLSVQSNPAGREARSCEVIAEFLNQLAESEDSQRIFVTLRQSAPHPT